MHKPNLVILAGLGDSGEMHWQTHWQQLYPNTIKVIQENWDLPQREDWIQNLNNNISKLKQPTILVAHSLAVSLVMHWNTRYSNPFIVGALLVAPADVDSVIHTPDCIRNFAPMPMNKLPFPSVVVASQNDPYASFERKKDFALAWGSDFVDVGHKGHINSETNLGNWEEGQMILQQLIEKINL
ncbi:RBBP9/YdeN family alpha/beta hydrolase [Flavobacterium agrisoli]|uniref:Alpha/beta hydrolase n=1 Tax=Flavobacterium agrisoli TaxID=2793066 RepID=A0A934UKN0_9FLAO|nr:alpha/beta hydrolase [Flavobacterium agrisoli]MBK0371147.1 alpha/beta hydrolase [Flavobacterium agrisoli]